MSIIEDIKNIENKISFLSKKRENIMQEIKSIEKEIFDLEDQKIKEIVYNLTDKEVMIAQEFIYSENCIINAKARNSITVVNDLFQKKILELVYENSNTYKLIDKYVKHINERALNIKEEKTKKEIQKLLEFKEFDCNVCYDYFFGRCNVDRDNNETIKNCKKCNYMFALYNQVSEMKKDNIFTDVAIKIYNEILYLSNKLKD